jgi:hypothetical protein
VEVEYILDFMRQFHFSYPHPSPDRDPRREGEFIPMLCNHEMPDQLPFAKSEASLHFRIRTQLPAAPVLHRLIVHMASDLDYGCVWYYGAHFHNQACDAEALVDAYDCDINLYLRSENDAKPYLTMIRAELYRIMQKPNGDGLEEFVCYKGEAGEAEIPYADLIDCLQHQEDTYRTRGLAQRIDIYELLGMFETRRMVEALRIALDTERAKVDRERARADHERARADTEIATMREVYRWQEQVNQGLATILAWVEESGKEREDREARLLTEMEGMHVKLQESLDQAGRLEESEQKQLEILNQVLKNTTRSKLGTVVSALTGAVGTSADFLAWAQFLGVLGGTVVKTVAPLVMGGGAMV